MAEEFSLEAVRSTAVGKSLSEEELNRFHAGFEEERDIPTRDGTAHIFFFAPSTEGTYPLVINLHGGGFVKGRRDQDTVFCRNLVENAGVVVVDVDYHRPRKRSTPMPCTNATMLPGMSPKIPRSFWQIPKKLSSWDTVQAATWQSVCSSWPRRSTASSLR